MPNAAIPTLKDIFVARETVSKYLKPTPLFHSSSLSRMLGCNAYVKLENLNPTRAFKVRGGLNFMERSKEDARRRGVITASSGNHSQSIAYAGALYGVKVKVVMPTYAPKVKIDATIALGAEVIIHGAQIEETIQYSEKLTREQNLLYVHSINEPLLYAGVATMHLEIIEELPEVDLVINPIGGGSGASGACIVYKTLDPKIQVIGAQAEGAPAFYQAWKARNLGISQPAKTNAEGLATDRAYELPLGILSRYLDDIVLVSDEEMEDAVRILYGTTGQIAELSGAAATAAALKMKEKLRDKNVALVLTGGNLAPESIGRFFQDKTTK